ncbi:MAG TPA: TIGR03435 family protein [Vicinamibacterales bacterium]|nr:TIGR03435 family protein [Vicinamibacterales bacterium]
MRMLAPCAAMIVVLGGLSTDAQKPTSASGPRFEVASVRPNESGDPHGRSAVYPGGRYMAVNVTLEELTVQAYGLQPSQLADGPGWMRAERFDVTARADGEFAATGAVEGAGSERLQAMLQALLADRFKFVAHRETREQPVYALVPARDDKALGPKMRVSTTDCDAPPAGPGRAGEPSPEPTGLTTPVPCTLRMGHGVLVARDATLGELAVSLSRTVQRVVHDQTGLVERYDMDMTFTPERMPRVRPADPDETSIFTALREQLGLKLESTRAPVEVIVIDTVERPTPD